MPDMITPKDLEKVLLKMDDDTFHTFCEHFDAETARVLSVHRSFLQMYADPEKYAAIRRAVGELLFTQFQAEPAPDTVKTPRVPGPEPVPLWFWGIGPEPGNE